MINGLTVNASDVLRRFANLTGREQKKVYKQALRKASTILTKETKLQLKAIVGRKINSRNRWNNKTLGSGIRTRIADDASEAKIHIMGDFRLKFFEKGTAIRAIRRGSANRGSMTPHYFFRKAKVNKEQEIFSNMDRLISESIMRISRP